MDLASSLASDTSKYAIMQGRPEELAALCEEARCLRDEGAKKGTSKRDAWGYGRVRLVCESEELTSPIMRPRAALIDDGGRWRESFWAALLLMKLILVIGPCPRQKAKGVTQGKPASAIQALYGYYSVQRDCGRYVPDFKMAGQHLRGLNERFKRLFGLDALVKQQAQPFSRVMLLALMALLSSGGGIPTWSSGLTACMQVLVCFSVMSGTRKNEFTKDGCTDNDYLRRNNFQWMDGEVEIPHTRENLLRLPLDAFLRGQAAPSKCDRYLQTWGNRMQWYQRDATNPLCFASAFLAYELVYPCPLNERHQWSAFSPTGDAQPFSPSAADTALRTLMTAALGAATAALRSWHAFRVTLASSLRGIPRKAGETTEDNNGVIQMLCRWSSVESVRTYSRINRHEYARYARLASMTCALVASNLEPLPPTDPSEVADEIETSVSSLCGKTEELAIDGGDDDVRQTTATTARAKTGAQPPTTSGKPAHARPPSAAPQRAPMAPTAPKPRPSATTVDITHRCSTPGCTLAAVKGNHAGACSNSVLPSRRVARQGV